MNEHMKCASAILPLGTYDGELVPGPEHETGPLQALPMSLADCVLTAFQAGLDVSDLRRDPAAAAKIRKRIWQHTIDDRVAYAQMVEERLIA